MKKILTFWLCLFASMNSQAQIAIDISSYGAWSAGSDTFQSVTNTLPPMTANINVDLSNAVYSSSFNRMKVSALNSSFPTASFNIPAYYPFSTFNYLKSSWCGISTIGYRCFGETVEYQAIGIAAQTGGAGDSLFIPTQTIIYSTPKKEIAFPLSFGSTYSSNYSFNTNFNLSIVAYGYNHIPGVRRSYVQKYDSVKAWGKIRVKNSAGLASGYMDVLGVQSYLQVQDSFFINGVAASPAVLAAIGLSQGMVTKNYVRNYFRAGEIEALYSAAFTNASYNVVSSATVHQSRLLKPTGVLNSPQSLSSGLLVYPNPASGFETLTIIADDQSDGNWNYRLLNTTGQIIEQSGLKMNAGKTTFSFAENPGSGLYYLYVLKNNQVAGILPLFLRN